MTSAELVFGSTALLSPNPPWDDYAIEATADGTTWGTPEAVVATVASMLMDGDKAKITRFGNREATIPIQIRGTSLDAVATGEAALMAEVNAGRNTLSWLPPGWSTASVFDVVYSTLEFKYDDLAESLHVTRYFTLTLACLPFARRAELTTVVADPIPAGSGTTTTIDACTSTTGWSGTTGATLSVYSGTAVNLTLANSTAASTLALTRAGSVSVPSGSYLVVDAETEHAASDYVVPWLYADGVLATLKATVPLTPTIAGGTGRVRAYYQLSGGATSLSSIRLFVTRESGMAPRPLSIRAHDVSTVTRLPFSGSVQQRSFSAQIDGTARTQADIAISITGSGDPGGEWSDVLIYTGPRDLAVAPPLRPWLTSSSTPTTDAARMSGARHTLAATSTYTVPMTALQAGTYLLVGRVARASGSGATQFAWTFSSDSTYAPSTLDVSGSVSPTLTTSYEFVEFGVATLPTVSVDGTGNVVLAVTSTAGATALIDELYLFNLDTGSLTWIEDIGSTAAVPNYFEIRAATLDTGRPDWRLGSGAGATVSAAERAKSPGVHECLPGVLSIFLAFPNTLNQTASLTLYERFRHHVPPKAS